MLVQLPTPSCAPRTGTGPRASRRISTLLTVAQPLRRPSTKGQQLPAVRTAVKPRVGGTNRVLFVPEPLSARGAHGEDAGQIAYEKKCVQRQVSNDAKFTLSDAANIFASSPMSRFARQRESLTDKGKIFGCVQAIGVAARHVLMKQRLCENVVEALAQRQIYDKLYHVVDDINDFKWSELVDSLKAIDEEIDEIEKEQPELDLSEMRSHVHTNIAAMREAVELCQQLEEGRRRPNGRRSLGSRRESTEMLATKPPGEVTEFEREALERADLTLLQSRQRVVDMMWGAIHTCPGGPEQAASFDEVPARTLDLLAWLPNEAVQELVELIVDSQLSGDDADSQVVFELTDQGCSKDDAESMLQALRLLAWQGRAEAAMRSERWDPLKLASCVSEKVLQMVSRTFGTAADEDAKDDRGRGTEGEEGDDLDTGGGGGAAESGAMQDPPARRSTIGRRSSMTPRKSLQASLWTPRKSTQVVSLSFETAMRAAARAPQPRRLAAAAVAAEAGGRRSTRTRSPRQPPASAVGLAELLVAGAAEAPPGAGVGSGAGEAAQPMQAFRRTARRLTGLLDRLPQTAPQSHRGRHAPASPERPGADPTAEAANPWDALKRQSVHRAQVTPTWSDVRRVDALRAKAFSSTCSPALSPRPPASGLSSPTCSSPLPKAVLQGLLAPDTSLPSPTRAALEGAPRQHFGGLETASPPHSAPPQVATRQGWQTSQQIFSVLPPLSLYDPLHRAEGFAWDAVDER